MNNRLPLVTTAAVLASGIAYAMPGAAEMLVFDRAAIVHGEPWRLITGNWVHFSRSHLAMDAVGLFIGAWMVERYSRMLAAMCILGAALVVGLGILGIEPNIERFGGLSGIVVAAMLLAGLQETFTAEGNRIAGGVLILAVVLKLVWELGAERTMLAESGDTIVVARLSHLVGAAYAILVFVAWIAVKGKRALFRLSFLALGLTGCATTFPTSTATRGATAAHAIRAEANSQTGSEPVTLELPLKVGVIFAADRNPGRVGTTLMSMWDPRLSVAEKTEITESVARSLRTSALIASAQALPPLDHVVASELRARAPDVVIIVGYDQTQRIRDVLATPMSMLSLAGMLGLVVTDTSNTKQLYTFGTIFLSAFAVAFAAPSQQFETSTVTEAVAYHQPSGRILFRAPSVVTRRRMSPVLGMRRASRKSWEEGVTRSVAGLSAEVARQLVEFEKRARSSPDEFRIVDVQAKP